jgi:hypothetical protein
MALYSNQPGHGQAPNPMKYAQESVEKASFELQTGRREPWPAHCLPGFVRPPKQSSRNVRMQD